MGPLEDLCHPHNSYENFFVIAQVAFIGGLRHLTSCATVNGQTEESHTEGLGGSLSKPQHRFNHAPLFHIFDGLVYFFEGIEMNKPVKGESTLAK